MTFSFFAPINSDEFLSQEEIDALWAEKAERRVGEIKTGKVKPIDGFN